MNPKSSHLKDSRLIEQGDLESPLDFRIGPNTRPTNLKDSMN